MLEGRREGGREGGKEGRKEGKGFYYEGRVKEGKSVMKKEGKMHARGEEGKQ